MDDPLHTIFAVVIRRASAESITPDRGYGFRARAKWRVPE